MARAEDKKKTKEPKTKPEPKTRVKRVKSWNSKQRRIWRRREQLRGGHTTRCATVDGSWHDARGNFMPGHMRCTCRAKSLHNEGMIERANIV